MTSGTVPTGCNCLTMSDGRLKSSVAGGKYVVLTTSLADFDFEATGGRFFEGVGFFATLVFLTGAGFLAGATGFTFASDVLTRPLSRAVAAIALPGMKTLKRHANIKPAGKIAFMNTTALTAEGHMLACCKVPDKLA